MVKVNSNLSIVEAFLYTTALLKGSSLLDVIRIEVLDEEYIGKSSITPYAQPWGWNTDFVKNEPMTINIANCTMKDSMGMLKSKLEINLFKILELQQKKIPIFLKVSGYNGPVLMLNWKVKRTGVVSIFSATFQTTTIIKPTKIINFYGTSSGSKLV